MEFVQFFVGRLRHSFWVLPLLGCVIGVALAAGVRVLDTPGASSIAHALPEFTRIEPESARTLFGAIAGAMATMLSLTYTLTLVVFTLAAGSLAPRLLESFSDNRGNQITIAVLGGTFLYALISLYLLSADRDPRFAALLAILLAMLSVVTLVLFVHNVAQRILVDNEVARAAERLKDVIALDFCEEPAPDAKDNLIAEGDGEEILAQRSGYIQTISENALIKQLSEADALLELSVAPGDFVAAGCRIATLRNGSREEWSHAIDRALVIGRSRTPDHDALFSVNLLVEIALRALSPGVNDSFTAVRCIDQLSAALIKASALHPRPRVRTDEDGEPRLAAPRVDFQDLLHASFEPIRQYANGNMLVLAALHRAFNRLNSAVPERRRETIETFTGRLPKEAQAN